MGLGKKWRGWTRVRNLMIGVPLALALTTCAPKPAAKADPASEIAAVMASLENEPFSFQGQTQTDIPALIAALPDWLTVTYASLNTEASGAHVLSDIVVGFPEAKEISLTIKQAKLWGFDTSFALARMKGERLTERALLARRIDLTGIKLSGLETFANEMNDTITSAVTDSITEIVPEEGQDAFGQAMAESASLTASSYTFSYDRVVFDNLFLRPFTLKLKEFPPAEFPGDPQSDAPAEAPTAPTLSDQDGIHFIQYAGAFLAPVDIDATLFLGGLLKFEGTESGQDMSLELKIGQWVAKGLRGGDLDIYQINKTSFRFSGDMPLDPASATDQPADPPADPFADDFLNVPSTQTTPTESGPVATFPLVYSGSFDSMLITDMRLNALYEAAARFEWPARTVTDLMSLGVWETTGESVSLNDKQIYRTEYSRFDASNWHWLLPTKLTFESRGTVYDIAAFTRFIQAVVVATPGAEAGISEQFDIALAVLAEQKAETFTVDGGMSWNASPVTGLADAGFNIKFGGGFDVSANMNLLLPEFAAIPAMPFETGGEDNSVAWAEVLETKLGFSGLKVDISDTGGIDRMLTLGIALGKALPAAEQSRSFLANQTPASLRTLATSGMSAGLAVLGDTPKFSKALSDLIGLVGTGGTFNLTLQPETPLKADQLQGLGLEGPAAIEKALGVTSSYTAPKKPS